MPAKNQELINKYIFSFLAVIADLETAFRQITNHCTDEIEDCYGYIPRDNDYFLTNLLDAIKVVNYYRKLDLNVRKNRLKFIDIGCGFGTKVSIAKSLGLEADGLEINKKTAKIAKLLKAGKIHIGNCVTWKHFGDYDILHYYTPLHDYEKGTKFEKNLFNSIKPGAVVVSCGQMLNSYDMPTGIVQVNKNHKFHSSNIYLKVSYSLVERNIKELSEFVANVSPVTGRFIY